LLTKPLPLWRRGVVEEAGDTALRPQVRPRLHAGIVRRGHQLAGSSGQVAISMQGVKDTALLLAAQRHQGQKLDLPPLPLRLQRPPPLRTGRGRDGRPAQCPIFVEVLFSRVKIVLKESRQSREQDILDRRAQGRRGVVEEGVMQVGGGAGQVATVQTQTATFEP
jgi:hypothetical protein